VAVTVSDWQSLMSRHGVLVSRHAGPGLGARERDRRDVSRHGAATGYWQHVTRA
jgi:hypothetical protein